MPSEGRNTMPKAERLEDLGEIRVKLEFIIDHLEDDWGHLLQSKHSFEEFYKKVSDEDEADDLHRLLRFHLEGLRGVLAIAQGVED